MSSSDLNFGRLLKRWVQQRDGSAESRLDSSIQGSPAIVDDILDAEERMSLDYRISALKDRASRMGLEEFRKAKAAFRAQSFEEVVHICTGQLSQSPNAVGVLYLRACAYGNVGKLTKAIADFSAAISICSTEPVFFFERSEAYRLAGELLLADADLRKAKKLLASANPDDTD